MRRRIADAARTLAGEALAPADPAALLAVAGETGWSSVDEAVPMKLCR
jgi:hypothetical protein